LSFRLAGACKEEECVRVKEAVVAQVAATVCAVADRGV